jgi:hypothetical protein
MSNPNITQQRKKNRNSFSRTDLILSNFLNFSTYVLGAVIMSFLGLLFLIIYVIFCSLAVIMFLKVICTYCPSYGKDKCSSGYGKVAAWLFPKSDPKKFSRMFKAYIPILSIIWFMPLVTSLYLLYIKFSLNLTIILIVFILIAFILLPYYSRVHSCKKCPNQKKCPWKERAE